MDQLETPLLSPPEGSQFVHLSFISPGSLGITLKRDANGRVYVEGVLSGSQAVDMDVRAHDTLWAVSDRVLGIKPVMKEDWQELVAVLKSPDRPLNMVMIRSHAVQTPTIIVPIKKDEHEAEQLKLQPLDQPLSLEHMLTDVSNAEPTPVEANPSADLCDLLARFSLRRPDPTSSGLLAFVSGAVTMTGSNSTYIVPQSFVGVTPESSIERCHQAAHDLLFLEGRSLVRVGLLQINVPGTLWDSTQQRYLFLFSDVAVIAADQASNSIVIPEHTANNELWRQIKFEVHNVFPLPLCRVHAPDSQGFTRGSGELELEQNDDNRCFYLQTPAGTMQFYAADVMQCMAWTHALWDQICSCVESANTESSMQAPGWRHRYRTGTLHAAVLMDDEEQVRELLATHMPSPATRAMLTARANAQDGDKISPLSYACMRGRPSVIQLLLEAGADASAVDGTRRTPCHWAAMQLDHVSLSLLCARVPNTDHLSDDYGRSPLVLACMEGRQTLAAGKDNGSASNGRLHNSTSALRSCLTILLAGDSSPEGSGHVWPTPLQAVAARWQAAAVEALCLAGADVNRIHNGYSALHCCCMRTFPDSNSDSGTHTSAETTRVAAPESSSGMETLRVLLSMGARPNGRSSAGVSPLALLCLNELAWGTELPIAVALLLQHGARWETAGAGPASNATDSASGDPLNAFRTRTSVAPVLQGAERAWAESSVLILEEKTAAAAGQQSATCNMCGFTYTFFKRQHHCVVCGVSSCDACCKRPATIAGKTVRCCDACYNRLGNNRLLSSTRNRSQDSPPANSADKKSSLLTRSRSPPLSPGKAGSFLRSGDKMNTGPGINPTMDVLAQTQEALQQRGERLEQAAEKSHELNEAASGFAEMARQLNRQQQSRWF